MPRFAIDPNKSAMENLWDAARIATAVILRSHNWYRLTGETRDELFDDVKYNTVRHFLEVKIRRHKYARTASDGTPLNFMDNVLGSCWAVAHGIADRHIKAMDKTNNTSDIEPCLFALANGDGLPLYLSYYESNSSKAARQTSYENLKKPYQRSVRVREMYEDYEIECEDIGATPLSFEQWLTSTGYNRDSDMMWQLLSKEEREEMERAKRMFDAGLTMKQIRKRDYEREWRRKQREAKKKAKCPPGYEWGMMNGVEGIRKIR